MRFYGRIETVLGTQQVKRRYQLEIQSEHPYQFPLAIRLSCLTPYMFRREN